MPATHASTVKSVRPYIIVEGADDLIAFLEGAFDARVLLRVPTPSGMTTRSS
jgi:uncharacterized glyoxalase superfamily protein PhnB